MPAVHDNCGTASPRLLTIIVPIYNVEPYLQACLASLVPSTHSHLCRLLLIDDRGSDNSMEIVEQFRRDAAMTVEVITHEANSGLSEARNTGIAHCDTEFLMFVDSDDWLEEGTMDTLLDTLLAVPDFDLLFFDHKRHWPTHTETRTTLPAIKASQFLDNQHRQDFYTHVTVTCWSKVFRTSLFKDLTFPRRLIFEDMAVMPIVLARAERIYYRKELYYFYRQREGSIMAEQRGDPESLMLAYGAMLDQCGEQTNHASQVTEYILVKDFFINCRVTYRTQGLGAGIQLLQMGLDWLAVRSPRWYKNPYVKRHLYTDNSLAKYLLIKAWLSNHFGMHLFLKRLNREPINLLQVFSEHRQYRSQPD